MLTLAKGGSIETADVHVVPEGGIGLVYCTDPGRAPQLRQRVTKLFTGKEGVAEVLQPEQFAEYGLPHPREYVQAPDLVIVAKDGYGVSSMAEGDAFVAANSVRASPTSGSNQGCEGGPLRLW